MENRTFKLGNKKYVVKKVNDKIYRLETYDGDEIESFSNYSKECYALTALRNKNGGVLPEEVISHTCDQIEVVEVKAKDIADKKPRLIDVCSKEFYTGSLGGLSYCNRGIPSFTFKLNGFSDVEYRRVDGRDFTLTKENEERKYSIWVVKGYIDFVRNFLYPEVEFDLAYDELFFNEHVTRLKEKVNRFGNSGFDLAFELYRFKLLKTQPGNEFFFNGDERLTISSFAEKYLGFCKTTTKYMLSIVEKFGNKDTLMLEPAYSDYSYSQLRELCSVDDEQLSGFSSNMSVREIIEKKKKLRSGDSNGEKEPKPKKVELGSIENYMPERFDTLPNFVTKGTFAVELYKYVDKNFVSVAYSFFRGLENQDKSWDTFFRFIVGLLTFGGDIAKKLSGYHNEFHFSHARNVEFLKADLRQLGYMPNIQNGGDKSNEDIIEEEKE